jgi:nitrogen fixation NifU-like protein
MIGSELYQDQILDHYRHPRNKGVLEQPEASYEDENPLCGDSLRIDLAYAPPLSQVAAPEERRIKEIRFSGSGCAISQAAASLLTELVAGQTVAEARALTKEDLLGELGIPLSPMRLKCALLALKVFKAALYGLGEGERPTS